MNSEPLSNTLNALVEAFKKNAALGAILERRRALEGRAQYVLQSQEAMDAVNRNLAPWARVGRAVEAKSARMAQRIAGVPDRTPDAADVMTDASDSSTEARWGTYTIGGSEASTRAPTDAGLQRTLDGRLGKSAPQRKKSSLGKTELTNSLITKWQAMP